MNFVKFAWLRAYGALAQLGERLLCKHQVIGSIPIGSTSFFSRYEDTSYRSFGAVNWSVRAPL